MLLSPSAHLRLAYVARQLDEAEAAEMESYIAVICVEGILGTGDGSRERPYLVTRTSDEYDVLQFLEKGFAGQALVHDGPRALDVLSCSDGSEICFDITEALARLDEVMGGE